jgi:hypothetical protein
MFIGRLCPSACNRPISAALLLAASAPFPAAAAPLVRPVANGLDLALSLGIEPTFTAAASLAARFFWAFALTRDLPFAAIFLEPAFPFFLAISVSLPMVIPLDGTWPKAEHSDPRHVGPDLLSRLLRFLLYL